MLFLVTAILYQSVKFILIQERTIGVIISLVVLLYSLFMFRTVLAAVLTCSFVIYGLVTSPMKNRFLNIVSVTITIIVFGYLIWNSQVGSEIAEYVSRINTVADHMEFRATRDGGNRLALIGRGTFVSFNNYYCSLLRLFLFPNKIFCGCSSALTL